MTLQKTAALTMLLVWPIAMYYDHQLYGAIHVMLAAALFLWFLQANPMDAKKPAKAARSRLLD
jgi:hypothetical protein